MKIRIGSRESKLAIIQSKLIEEKINKAFPQYETEIITMKTTGDRILDRTLDKIGGKGLFTKEIEKALKENRIDIAVHSLKDIPLETDIPVTSFSERLYPYDVLVLPVGSDKLDLSKPVGTSSKRREIQLKKLYPDAEIVTVRGNVLTRLKKLDSGEFGCLILAQAGLVRLGMENRITKVFTEDEMIPSAGQGIIAVQSRKGYMEEVLKKINNKNSEICALAERAYVKAFNGGCSSPVAAYAKFSGNNVIIKGFYCDDNVDFTVSAECHKEDAVYNAVMLAEKTKEMLRRE